jgi:RNA recognition motif-containing protein
MQIYVGNLPTTHTDDDLRKMFEPHGKVRSAVIGKDRKTGESEGYGFVEMPVKSEGRAAIEALRGKEMKGKPLLVRALKPGDEFHQHAMNMQGSARGGGKILPRQVQGNLGPRGAGAIRRGGQRGT